MNALLDPKFAVIPILVGPLQVLMAMLPAILLGIGSALLALFKPATFKLAIKLLWRVKVSLLIGIVIISGSVFGARAVWRKATNAISTAEVAAHDWPTFRGNAQRTGALPSGASPLAGGIQWAFAGEAKTLRAAYGEPKFGQSVLLTRRLMEAGTRLVQVNWPREGVKEVGGSPLWDTHSNNAGRVRDVLCPQFDRTYATLIEDLAARGLLDETLVVVMGEFGRSPKINGAGGRDHWGSVFSVALAGAGIGGGQIIGESDRIGAMPAVRPVRPPDLAATIFHLLGIASSAEFLDPIGRPRSVTDNGQPLREVIGA